MWKSYFTENTIVLAFGKTWDDYRNHNNGIYVLRVNDDCTRNAYFREIFVVKTVKIIAKLYCWRWVDNNDNDNYNDDNYDEDNNSDNNDNDDYDHRHRWIQQDTIDSMLILVMLWCRQATSNHIVRCRSTSITPHGVTRPQRFKWTKPAIMCCSWLFLRVLFDENSFMIIANYSDGYDEIVLC